MDTSIYRPATYIEGGAHNLELAFLLALVLAIIAIGALLYEWRSATVAIGAILTSLAAAWLVLDVTHTTVNSMVLAGLVIALLVIVDDAIGAATAAASTLRQQRMNGVEPHAATVIRDTLVALQTTMVFATLVAVVVVIPLFFVQGEAAPFLPPIVLSFGLGVVVSMIVALVVTPALAMLLLLGTPVEHRDSPVTAWMTRGYTRAVTAVTDRPRSAYIGAGALGVAGLLALPFLVGSALPSFRDGNLLIDLQAVPGTSLPEMDRITDRVAVELGALPGVADVGAQIGRAISSDQVVGVDAAQIWVSLDPDEDHDATLASVQQVVGGYPGLDHSIRTYSDERIARVLTDTGAPILVRVYGQNAEELQEQADLVRDTVAGIEGIVDPRVEIQAQQPTIDVRVDLERAERAGIVPGDVRRAAATLMSGIGVGSLFEQQKVFDVVVWGTPATRASLGSVRDLLIDTSQGGHIRLGRVAGVSVASTAAVIRHQDLSRTLDVTANVQGRSVDDVAADVGTAIGAMAFPLEYHAELVAEDAEHRDATQRAIAIAVAAAISLFLLLQAALGSWRLSLAAFLTLPLAVAGCLLAVLVTGRVFSIGSLIGCVGAAVLSVRVGLASLRHHAELQRRTGDPADAALVQRAARERFAPIVTTAVTLSVALLPFAMSGGVAGQEVLRPLAAAAIGGVVASALIGAFVLPALYLRFAPAVLPDALGTQVVVVPELEHAPEV
jgi:Cu/Ag efflux pump CusA